MGSFWPHLLVHSNRVVEKYGCSRSPTALTLPPAIKSWPIFLHFSPNIIIINAVARPDTWSPPIVSINPASLFCGRKSTSKKCTRNHFTYSRPHTKALVDFLLVVLARLPAVFCFIFSPLMFSRKFYEFQFISTFLTNTLGLFFLHFLLARSFPPHQTRLFTTAAHFWDCRKIPFKFYHFCAQWKYSYHSLKCTSPSAPINPTLNQFPPSSAAYTDRHTLSVVRFISQRTFGTLRSTLNDLNRTSVKTATRWSHSDLELPQNFCTHILLLPKHPCVRSSVTENPPGENSQRLHDVCMTWRGPKYTPEQSRSPFRTSGKLLASGKRAQSHTHYEGGVWTRSRRRKEQSFSRLENTSAHRSQTRSTDDHPAQGGAHGRENRQWERFPSWSRKNRWEPGANEEIGREKEKEKIAGFPRFHSPSSGGLFVYSSSQY